MTHASEETTLFGERAAVADDSESIHLKAVVVMKTKWIMLDNTWIELETTYRKTVARTRVAAIEDRHIVFLCHTVDRIEKWHEILLCVNILLAVGR